MQVIQSLKNRENSDVGFAIVLYTPCDEGKSKRPNNFTVEQDKMLF